VQSKADIVIDKKNVLYCTRMFLFGSGHKRLAFIAFFFVLNGCANLNEIRVNPRTGLVMKKLIRQLNSSELTARYCFEGYGAHQ